MQNEISKSVNPFITCIIVSHNKPKYVCDSINSVYEQNFSDWQCVVIDSGVLYDAGYFEALPAMKDPRFVLVRSLETEKIRKTKIPHSWCVNSCINSGLITSDFIIYCCDDDWLYPDAFKRFFEFAQEHNDAEAMYGSMDFIIQKDDGSRRHHFRIEADVNRGSFCKGPSLRCQVDGGQICHKLSVLKKFKSKEYWPEDLSHMRAGDGQFLETLGSLTTIYAVPAFTVGCNRKVPESINDGHKAR